jgi:uncharacterized protein YjbI with pentapeptide repeats
MSGNIDFVLKRLYSDAFSSLLANLPSEQIPIIDTSATGVFYMRTSDLRKIFQFQTDAININDLSSQDLKYYVNMNAWPEFFDLNPANAMMDQDLSSGLLSVNPIAFVEGNGQKYSPTKMFVKDDFIRYLALSLFGTYSGVDLFNNKQSLEDNVQAQCDGSARGHSWYDISASLYSVDMTLGTNPGLLTDISGLKYMTRYTMTPNNLCRELMNQIGYADPNRFSNIISTANMQPVPFYDGDSISFVLSIRPAPGQETIVRLTNPIPPRNYRIKIYMISDTDTVHQNTSPYTTFYTAAYYYSKNVSVGLIYDVGFSWEQILAGGYTLQDVRNANIMPLVLRLGGFTATQIVSYYTAQQLQTGGYTIQNLLDASFTIMQLNRLGYNATQYVAAGFTASSLFSTGYSLADLVYSRFTASQLNVVGFTATQLKDMSFSLQQLKDGSYNCVNLQSAGYTVAQLKSVNFSIPNILTAYSLNDISNVGYMATDFSAANISTTQLFQANYTVVEMKRIGYSAADLKSGGFAVSDMKNAGYTILQFYNARYLVAEIVPPFNLIDLSSSLYKSQDYNNSGVSLLSLINAGFTVVQLLNNGYTVLQLAQNGASSTQLVLAGVKVSVLRNAGYSFNDILSSALGLIDASYSIAAIVNYGYSASELKTAGLTATQIINAGFNVNNNRASTASALQQAGYSALDLARAGFTSSELRNAGYTLSEIVVAIASLASG